MLGWAHPILRALALDHDVATEVTERSEREADRDRVGAADPERFLGQLEGEGADQRPGPKAEHEPDHPWRDRGAQPDCGADEQRGSTGEAPCRGFQHPPTLTAVAAAGL
jgi:hypothetical protein